MDEQKKTALNAANIEDGTLGGLGQTEHITLQADGQGFRVCPLLPQGSSKAISSTTLSALVGCDPRNLRFLVAEERARGAVILSDGHGYFRPSDGQAGRTEMEAFISCLIHRGVATIRATDSARKALGVCLNQIDLDELLKGLAQEAQTDG